MQSVPPPIPADPARRVRRRVLGVSSYVLGCLFAVLTVAAAFALFGGGLPKGLAPVIAGAVGAVVLLVVAVVLLVVAEQCFVPSATEVLEHDSRAPVVYLRPFGEDAELTYDVISTGESTTAITAKAEDFLLALNAIGPLVSIAEPDRWARWGLHPHGAYRDFVGEGDWQARVQTLLDRAGLVVLAIGDSPGIEWEIEQVRQRVGPQSLLLYLPPRPANAFTRKGRQKKEKAIYEQFAPLVEKHFELTLPPFAESTYLIGFDADGQPVMAPNAPRKRWVFTEHGRVADAIGSQLRAVLAKVRPGTSLDPYRIAGRSGMWGRFIAATCVVLASVGVALSGSLNGDLLGFATRLVPSLPLIAGWWLLARHFRSRWAWAAVLLLISLTALSAGVHAWVQFVSHDPAMLGSVAYNALVWLLLLGNGIAVLALGLSLIGRHDPSR